MGGIPTKKVTGRGMTVNEQGECGDSGAVCGGEIACVSVHGGANRLGGNSLLDIWWSLAVRRAAFTGIIAEQGVLRHSSESDVEGVLWALNRWNNQPRKRRSTLAIRKALQGYAA